MKKVLLFAVFTALFSATTVQAQGARYGFKIGLNFSSINSFDFDVVKSLKRSLDSLMTFSPTHWFTRELQAFFNLQQNNSGDEINAKQFINWILNVKIVYLSLKEIGDLKLPSTTVDNNIFIQACVRELALKSPGSHEVLSHITQFFYKINVFICL